MDKRCEDCMYAIKAPEPLMFPYAHPKVLCKRYPLGVIIGVSEWCWEYKVKSEETEAYRKPTYMDGI